MGGVMKTIRLRVVGMHCEACVGRITKRVMKLNGVQEANVKLDRARATVTFDEQQTTAAIIQEAIAELGYDVSERARVALWPLLLGAIVFLLLSEYRVGRTFLPQLSASGSYGLVFLVGVLTSLHCVAMCGGFVFSQGFNQKDALLFQSARVLSYTLVGAAAGALGSVVALSGPWRGAVAILAGVFMVSMALRMMGLVSFGLPHWLAPRLPKSSLIAGLLAGLMPCGPLNTMQIYALGSGSALRGALTMFFFALGTLPLMGLVSLLGSMIGERMNAKLARVSAALLIGMGLTMGLQGLALSGVPVRLSFERPVAATMVGQTQVINMTADFGSYSPKTFILKAGVPVEWKINVVNLDDCITPITIPALKVDQALMPGVNTITFTPEKEGDLAFTCWMGMIRGVFKVKG